MSVRTTARHRGDASADAGPAPRRVPTNLSLPEDLVAELDEIAGPRNRSAFVEGAVRRALRREQFRLAGERYAGSLDPSDYPHWRSSEDIVGWVREIRAEETDSGADPA